MSKNFIIKSGGGFVADTADFNGDISTLQMVGCVSDITKAKSEALRMSKFEAERIALIMGSAGQKPEIIEVDAIGSN